MRFSSNLRRFRWVVFTGWLLAVIPSLYLAGTQSGHLTGGGFEVRGSQSLHVQYELEDHFPEQGASPLALVAAPRADATYRDMKDAVALLKRAAGEVPSVTVLPDTTQPPPRPDRPYVVSLRVDFNNTGAVDVAKKLRTKLGVEGEHPGRVENGSVNLYVIGQGALGAAASAKTKQDIGAAEQWNLPIVLIVLLAVFGSLAAAAIPLALGIGTVIVTMGLVYLLSMFTTMSVFVTSTVSMFGIALAIDYSLFILMRYREELRAGRQPQEAVDAAMATSGLAVVLSGLTVVASLTGIYLINTPVLVSMATGAILSVSVAVLASVSLTPVVLAVFGRAVAKRSALLHWARSPQPAQSRFWTSWTASVMRRPWVSALLAAGFLLALAAPALSLSLGNSMLRQFDSSHEIRGGVAAAAQALGPGALGPVRVLVTIPGEDASAPKYAETFAAIRQEMAQAPNIASVSPPVFGDNNSGLLSAVLSVDPEDMAARTTVDWMREHLPQAAGSPAVQVYVGGPTALIKDFDDRVEAAEPMVLVFVALIAFLMLLVSIQSVLLALKGVVMTVLSVAAAYGSLVMVFQWGWFERFGFASTGSIDTFIPPLVLAMTFGLSMDYEIFLLTRIRERFLQTGNTHDAVAYGVSTSARTITSAALIMIAVFIGFAFAGMPLVAELGVACAVAIAVDATVVRLVLVPALMAMFAEWNWWLPRWLARILPSVDFEKPLPSVDLGDVVVIPDDISALITPSADLRVVVKSAARLKGLAPDVVCVSDPLALRGCGVAEMATSRLQAAPADTGSATAPAPAGGRVVSQALARLTGGWQSRTGTDRAQPRTIRPVHPVTVWRRRLAIALDALETESWAATEIGLDIPPLTRCRPMEAAAVQLPTGDRLQIPTGAETLRLAGYLVLARNSRRDYAALAELADALGPKTVADALCAIDAYYSGQPADGHWMATQLVCRLADPEPTARGDYTSGDDALGASTDWEHVQGRCLAVAVAMLEEAR